MAEVKITDLVEQSTIDRLKELDTTMQTVLSTYTTVAKDMAKGIDLNVKVVGDIDKLNEVLVKGSKDAADANKQLTSVLTEQQTVIANTTNTIQRQLMEQERVNKATRESYTEQEKVKNLLDHYHDTYANQIESLVKVTNQIDKNKKAQKENEEAYKKGAKTHADYIKRQTELVKESRTLAQEKRTLNQVLTAEEKAMLATEGSYNQMSQELELLKKAYKDLSEEGRNSDIGKEMEASIQNLDAKLKDMAADMGEFQRNVGNYAIAGQAGVVSTESLVAAMSQEANTTQDLIDQTKILEEGKVRLDQNDQNYAATLASVNAKIEENKAKLTDVSDILHKDATSVAEAEEQNKRLQEALKHVDLSSDGAKERVKEFNEKIAQNTKLIKDNTPALQDNAKAAEGMAGKWLSFLGINGKMSNSLMVLGQGTTGLTTKMKALGQAGMALMSNPWFLAIAGIGAAVAAFKGLYDYNKGLIEASRLTENFTGETGRAADVVTAKMSALADTMDKGYNETISAANTLVQQFGISWQEAIDLMKDGLQAGADMNGNFVANIERFGPALRDAGVDARQFVAILAETRNGIFNEKGVDDILKGGTRLRAMTKNIAAALDDVGISSSKMQKDLNDGTITMLEAVQQVANKLKELPENSQEAGTLMKQVFGRTASEGGALLIQSIADINTNLDEQMEKMGELGEANRRQADAQEKLQEATMALFKMNGTTFETMMANAKAYVYEGLTKIIKGLIGVCNWFIDLYNRSIALRGAVASIKNGFNIVWQTAKFVVSQIIDAFKSLGTVIDGILTFDPDKVARGWKEGVAALGKNAKAYAQNIAGGFTDAWNETVNNRMKPIDENAFSGEASGNKSAAGGGGGASSGGGGGGKTDKAAAAAAKKAAEQQMKILEQLEESKLELMAEGHEKEMLKIKLQYKKKIEAVKGNSDNEIQLRLQLVEQMNRALADCEYKYLTQLSKTNLDNRLEIVEKGSKEERDLKLAKLLMQYEEEKKLAEQKGYDLQLIEEKYAQKRAEVTEAYASSQAQAVQERYAEEQTEADNAQLSAVAALQMRYAAELALVGGNAEKRVALKEKLEQDLAALERQYALATSRNSIKMLEEVLQTEELSDEDRAKYAAELAKKKAELEKQMADAAVEGAEKAAAADEASGDRRKKVAAAILQATADSISQITSLVDQLYENKTSKIEKEEEANTAALEKETTRITDMVSKKVITEEEGEARKRAAEKKTSQQNEELEKKKAKLKEKQAKYDKAAAIAQAGISTALAIMNALKTEPAWLGIALAAVVGAMGAVQIATILATPLAKYAKGTDYHPGGLAVVGDGGREEVVLIGNKAWITPDTPTLVDMPRGSQVLPSIEDFEGSLTAMVSGSADSKTPVIVNTDNKSLEREMRTVSSLIRQQTRQQHLDKYALEYELFKSKI